MILDNSKFKFQTPSARNVITANDRNNGLSMFKTPYAVLYANMPTKQLLAF